ncbi:serine/threonine-protein kinase [Streptomyces decoyicus]|uniref:serine/threonine-protein kinase n=1 Tax=Streptomyces decoyicus TaxID=249567 RepID=UPI00345CDB33
MLIASRYRLQDVVGRGAVGEVWRAFDESLGRPVAVKLLLPQGSDPSAASRFRLEAQTAGRLNHPHVVGVLDFGEHEDRLFLVMELVEGVSLARLAGSGPLLAERVALIAAQAAAGLAAAHRHNIVHRDIKPANLLLDTHGALKIGDFGIARFVDDPGAALTATGQIIGTSLYLAPERALGRPAGPASDVYALGCVLYQLLTGRPPFQADTALATLHQHLDASPVPPRQLGTSLPPAFENYLLGLLAKQPEDRPTAQQVADWFGRGAWRGAPEPLPQELPDQGRRTAPSAVRGPHITGPGAAVPGPPTAGTAVPAASVGGVYAPTPETEWKTTVHRAAPHRSRLPFTLLPRLVALLGGAALFFVALLAGLTWFSPGTGTAQVPQAEPSAVVNPSISPSPTSNGTAPSPSPSLASSAAQTADEKTAKPVDAKKRPKAAGKHGGKGKH